MSITSKMKSVRVASVALRCSLRCRSPSASPPSANGSISSIPSKSSASRWSGSPRNRGADPPAPGAEPPAVCTPSPAVSSPNADALRVLRCGRGSSRERTISTQSRGATRTCSRPLHKRHHVSTGGVNWPLHDIAMTNSVWCIAYKREVGREVVYCPIIVQ